MEQWCGWTLLCKITLVQRVGEKMKIAATSFKVQNTDWHSAFEQTVKPHSRWRKRLVELCVWKWRHVRANEECFCVAIGCRLNTLCVLSTYWLSTVASTVTCFSCSINVSRVDSCVLADIWTECYCTCSREMYACGLDCGPFWFQQGSLSLAGCTGVAIVDTTFSSITSVFSKLLRLLCTFFLRHMAKLCLCSCQKWPDWATM